MTTEIISNLDFACSDEDSQDLYSPSFSLKKPQSKASSSTTDGSADTESVEEAEKGSGSSEIMSYPSDMIENMFSFDLREDQEAEKPSDGLSFMSYDFLSYEQEIRRAVADLENEFNGNDKRPEDAFNVNQSFPFPKYTIVDTERAKDIICFICGKLPVNAVTHNFEQCSGIFCKECIMTQKNCPGCRMFFDNMNTEERTRMFENCNGTLKNMINKTLIHCSACQATFPNSEYENHCVSVCPIYCNNTHCGSEETRISILNHHRICPYAKVSCSSISNGCPWEGARKDLNDHKEINCGYKFVGPIKEALVEKMNTIIKLYIASYLQNTNGSAPDTKSDKFISGQSVPQIIYSSILNTVKQLTDFNAVNFKDLNQDIIQVHGAVSDMAKKMEHIEKGLDNIDKELDSLKHSQKTPPFTVERKKPVDLKKENASLKEEIKAMVERERILEEDLDMCGRAIRALRQEVEEAGEQAKDDVVELKAVTCELVRDYIVNQKEIVLDPKCYFCGEEPRNLELYLLKRERGEESGFKWSVCCKECEASYDPLTHKSIYIF